MKKVTLSLAILATVYAAVSCADQNRQEPQPTATERAARIGDDGDDEPGSGADRCAAMDVLKRNLDEDPGLEERMNRIEEQTNRFVARALAAQKGEGGASIAAAFNGVLTIPVVVNVVYRTNQQNISQAQIQSQIDVLNQDFRKTNPDVAQTPGVFQPLTADFEIQFTLAAVNRRASSRTSWGTNDWVKSARRGGINPTDPSRNLNIWICNIGGGILGYAQFPGGNPATDGVVISPQYFGTRNASGGSAFFLSAPYDKGRTATHEIGHWINLRHIWGDARCGNDLVADTPTQQTSNGGCPTFPKVTCSNGPNGDMFMNYMDYTNDACMFMFTNGQKTRARAVFASDGPRASFTQNQ